MRLAIVATGRSVELFDRYKLNIVDGALKLSVKDADSALLSDRVTYRLQKLSNHNGYMRPLVLANHLERRRQLRLCGG